MWLARHNRDFQTKTGLTSRSSIRAASPIVEVQTAFGALLASEER
jgi:hypothetical protein